MIQIRRTKEFCEWLITLTAKEQLKVDARLERIHDLEHFGDAKSLGDGLAELRWHNGWRVYFVKETSVVILLLIGGHKNGQKKDIEKARILARRYSRH